MMDKVKCPIRYTIVKGLLKEGGYIAGSVSNRERLFVEMVWKSFHEDYPPHHFLRFSRPSVEKASNFAGFKDIEVYKGVILWR
jgi:hypothetical protein